MQKQTVLISCSPEVLGQLEDAVQNDAVSPRIAKRAQIILDTLNGLKPEEIAEKLQISQGVYCRWVRRFQEKGIAGLWDKPHTGRAPMYDRDFEKRVLALLDAPPPEGQTCWDGTMLAKALNSSDDAVWRTLRKHNITLARRRVWMMDLPALFSNMDRHLVGMFLAPPVYIFVFAWGDVPENGGCVITRNRKAGDVLTKRSAADGSADGQEVMAALAAVTAPMSVDRRNSEMMEFLQSVARDHGEGARLCVVYTGDPTEYGVNNRHLGHTWMEFIPFNKAKDRFADWLRFPSEFQNAVMAYPAAAPFFRWQKIKKTHVD